MRENRRKGGKLRLTLAILGTAYLIALVCCTSPVDNEHSNGPDRRDLGGLSLLIEVEQPDSLRASTLLPEYSFAEYEISFDGPAEWDTIVVGTDTPTFDVPVGTWTITVRGRVSPGGATAAEGSKEIAVGSGTTNESITIVPSQSGGGSVDITIDWPDTLDVPVSTVTGTFTEVGSPLETATFTIDGSSATHADDYGSGEYELSVSLWDGGGSLLATLIELVKVFDNISTSASISVAESDMQSIPAAPSDLSAIAGEGFVTLSWTDNSATETGFRLFRSSFLIGETAANQEVYIYDSVNEGENYTFRVRATNDFGDSDSSSDTVSTQSRVWADDVVDSLGDVGQYTSIALDPAGRPHISYYDVGNGNLKYARLSGDDWNWVGLADPASEPDTVDGTTDYDVGRYTSIAIDEWGWPHISYYDATRRVLKYARWNGTEWDGWESPAGPDIVEETPGVGLYSSIALDENGYPHISYHDSRDDYLKYARWNGTDEWVGMEASSRPDTVDASGDVGGYTSIALDSGSNPHISYFDTTNVALRYIRWNEADSEWEGWLATGTPDTVDSEGEVGMHSSIALDSSGFPHISYQDVNGGLKFARRHEGIWAGMEQDQPEIVDSSGDVGAYTSIAVDSDGYPHISYHDPGNEYLKYVHWSSHDGWAGVENDQPEMLFECGSLGGYTSIALDSEGSPHISFCGHNGTSSELVYAFVHWQ